MSCEWQVRMAMLSREVLFQMWIVWSLERES